jgi:hypothetical protein
MADGVAITAGSGTTILTDDTGAGGHAQIVKLAISTDGSGTLLPADANGLTIQGPAAHDATVAGNPIVVGGVSSAAAPTSVTNDGEAVRAWFLRNGAAATVLTAAGALIGGDATNGLDVDVTRVTGTVTTTAAGDVAHDTADSGSPQKIGAKAESSLAGITLVADADRTDLYADLDGVLVTKPHTVYGDILVERATNTDGASTALSTFGATASARNFVSTITVYNSSTTNGYLDLRDGTAGSILYTIPLPALGGATINFPVPLRQTTANTALAIDVSAALSTVYVSLVGFKSKA